MDLNKLGQRLLGLALVASLVACGEPEGQTDNINHISRAKAYQEQGQYKAAIIEYKNAVKKGGTSSLAAVEYADMLNRLGNHSSALGLLEQVSENKDERYFLELVETFQGMKKYRSAGELLDRNLSDASVEVKKLIAENYLGLTEFEQALSLYQGLLDQNQGDGDALLGKASALVRSGKVNESIEVLKRIEASSSAAVKANILLAGIQINQDKLEQAEATLSTLLSEMPNTDIIEPEKAVVLERLAYVLTRQGRSNEAYIYSKLLSEAFPGSNEAKEQYQLAVEKLQSNELGAAKEILLSLLETYPGYVRATQLLGIVSYLQGDNQLASKYLSDSVDPEVASALTTHVYAATNLKLNEPKKVLAILEPDIEKTQVPATLALYGLAAISDKQYAKGEKVLLRALALEPSNVRVRLALAGLYRSGPALNKQKEWAQLQKAYETDSQDKHVLKDIVSYHLRQQSVEDAKRFLDKALAKDAKGYAVNLVAGYFSLNQKQVAQALSHFTAASAAKADGSDLMNALFAKGKAEITLQKMAAAKKTFLDMIHKFPDSELGYKGLLSIYLFDGKEAEGQKELESLAERNAQLAPYLVLIQSAVARQDVTAAKQYHDKAKVFKADDPAIERLAYAIRYVEAVLAMQQRNFDEARSIVASILSSEPDNLRLLSFLVELEIRAGNTHEAAKVLKQVENVNPTHLAVSLLKGDLALANKDLDSAKTHYTQAWKGNPSEVSGDKLFRVLGMMKQKAEQNKHVEEWLLASPNSVSARLYQAINHQQRGQRLKAMEGYERLLKLAPNHAMALNNLGWIYFEKKDDRALAILKRAHEMAPESAAILDSYGWVLAQQGQVEKGLKLLEKANQLAPGNKEIAEHLDAAKKL